MWKQILSKLPRSKSSKSESNDSAKIASRPARTSSNQAGNNEIASLHSNNNNANANVVATSRSNSGKKMSSVVFPSSIDAGIEPLVAFKDVQNNEKLNLCISKLSLCCVVFDFTDASRSLEEKELKRATLIELVDFVGSGPPKFTEPVIIAMCKMCCNNLFRDFPPNSRSNSGSGENDDDEPMFDPSWSHLQIVYDLLLKFVISPSLEAKIAKKYFNQSFIIKLLDLFDSEDPRERESIKTIMHRIYGKFMVHRPFIRKGISNIFLRFAFENEKHNGIAELLEIFGSVISGFAIPLKEEHKIFLCRALIPLHKSKSLGVYFQQLSYCVTQFIEKDPKLASTVIRGLLKYWPVTSSQKEVMFLGEIEEILEGINMGEFQKIMVPLFGRIGCCINSSHFQVAERALFLWNNDQITNLVTPNRHIILPIIFPALERNSQTHWNQSVLNLTLNVTKMLNEMDDELFLACKDRVKEEQAKVTLAKEKRKEAWLRLENAASLKPITDNTAVLISHLAISTC